MSIRGVAVAAVIGVSDRNAGQVPVAAVQLQNNENITEDELLTLSNAQLSDCQKLVRIQLVNGFERNAGGKIIIDRVLDLFTK